MFVLSILAITNLMATETYSQTASISLQLKDATVKEVLSKIEDNSEFFFLYNSKLVDVDRKVSMDINNEKINEILSDIFSETDVTWTVVDQQIVLTNKVNLISSGQPFSQQIQKISGTVTDKDGSPLPGVNVSVGGTTAGVVTDINGNYRIEVPQGGKSLTFSFVGMKSQEIVIGASTQINVTMAESEVGLDEVVVIGYGTQKKIDLSGSVTVVSSKNIVKEPVSAGENCRS
jgi:hypothetical protein